MLKPLSKTDLYPNSKAFTCSGFTNVVLALTNNFEASAIGVPCAKAAPKAVTEAMVYALV